MCICIYYDTYIIYAYNMCIIYVYTHIYIIFKVLKLSRVGMHLGGLNGEYDRNMVCMYKILSE